MDDKTKIFWLGVAVVFGCLIYIACVTFLPIPPTGIKYADMAVPFLLGSGFGMVIGYYWGTSQGSSDKSKTIDKALNAVVNQPPPPPPEVK